MLSSLHIENVAVIKNADIDFSGGFSVLTGETGAGKSIIIDSLGLILGAKQSKDIIRNGEEFARVSAIFTSLSEYSLMGLGELGILADDDGILMIERVLTVGGKSTARVNGRQVPISLLRDASKYLIAVHGQHDNMSLLEVQSHLSYLDLFALSGDALLEYDEIYTKYCDIDKKIKELTEDDRQKAQKLEFLRYQIKEIEAAKLHQGEEEQLLEVRKKLQNSEKIAQLTDNIYTLIYRNDKNTSALDKVKRAEKSLEALASMLPEAEELIERLENISCELEDIGLTIEAFSEETEENPTAKLDKVEGRLYEISKLERKYGDSLADVLEYLEKSKTQLEEIELSEERLAELEKERALVYRELEIKGEELSKLRIKAGEKLSKSITDELSYLDMNGAVFGVNINPRLDAKGETVYQKSGKDDIEFLICTNKGEPMKPLAKIASGGELSRIMLAIKTVLLQINSPDTLIFDEVDTGVSGKTSQKIGIKLARLAKEGNMQVMSVTHAAQIAAVAEHHYYISKEEQNGRVSTKVEELSTEGRIREVARIMGGINITDTLLKTAREMIEEKI